MKTNTIHMFAAKFLAVVTLSVAGVPQIAAAAETYCQQEGHGANGCSDLFEGGGYCWENSSSNTGYVCREDDPNASVEPSEEVVASMDPVMYTPADLGGDGEGPEVEPLEIVICGPDGGAGCFTWAIPDVCCEDIGLPLGEPLSVGGATITCYD